MDICNAELILVNMYFTYELYVSLKFDRLSMY